ncbi:MAG: hypothetical protein Q9M19_05205 [Mariprofundaceae bacterium]|nr:hypothetical protein [Mariprofundaceae bacterium]
MPHYRRFQDISVSEKLLNSMFLLMIAVAYLFALLHMYYAHEGRDGEAGLSVKDVMIAYHGSHDQTRLGAAIKGSMGANLPSAAAKNDILDWINLGAHEDDYQTRIRPIFENNCIACHSVDSGMPIPSLESFADVRALTHTDTGATIPTLVRVSHIHLFGIAFILFFVGRIFLLCEMPALWKRVAVIIPFAAVLIDILSWYITKSIPGFAYVVVISGGLMGLSLWFQIGVSMYQMWFHQKHHQGEVT